MYWSESDEWFGVMMVRYGDALARQPTVERSPIVYCVRLVVLSESGSGKTRCGVKRYAENNNDERLKLQEAEYVLESTSGRLLIFIRRRRRRAKDGIR